MSNDTKEVEKDLKNRWLVYNNDTNKTEFKFFVRGENEKLKVLGKGTQGEVLLVYQLNNPNLVEKVYKDGENANACIEFLREVEVLRKVRNLPFFPVLYGWNAKRKIFRMEYIHDIVDLRKFVMRDANFDLNERLFIFLQILEAVSILHSKGIIHNDLKEENFLYNSKGKKLYLIDFGLSLLDIDDEENIKILKGTMTSFPPQKLNKQIKTFEDAKKAEIFAIGCIAVKLLLDQDLYENIPHDVDLKNLLKKTTQECIDKRFIQLEADLNNNILPKKVDKELIEIIRQMLIINPDKRTTIEKTKKYINNYIKKIT